MTRKLSGLFLSAALATACGSSGHETASRDAGVVLGETCTPQAACGGCGTCFDSCRCGGGTVARCANECTPATDGGASVDAGPGPGTDGGIATPYTSTLVIDAFDIPPGKEFFRCQNFANPFERDVVVLESDSFMTSGSHHMFVFVTPNGPNGELEECGGLEFGPNLHGTQRSQERFTYPPGVGSFLSSGQGLRIQVHFLHAAEPSTVPVHASHVFANTIGIGIPPHQKGTVKHSCLVPKDSDVFLAASHMHQHGTHFVARSSDGQLLYETSQWAEPEPWRFTPARHLKAGTTIDVTCDYENTTDSSLGFGESAATNEMCIFTGAYYPAVDGESITCLF